MTAIGFAPGILERAQRILNEGLLMRKTLFLILLFSLLLIACSSGQPRLAVEVEHFDFGDVVNGEVLTRVLEVSNLGDAPLVVEAVSTSCGCTKATLDPMTIPPGDRATLRVVYDSGAHGPEETGPVMRQIFIASNDPDRSDFVIEFESNVLPAGGS